MNEIIPKRFVVFLSTILCCASITNGQEQPETRWSVTLAEQNSDWLSVKIDTTKWARNAVCSQMSIKVEFYADHDQKTAIATETLAVSEETTRLVRPGAIKEFGLNHSHGNALSVKALSIVYNYDPEGGKFDGLNAVRVESKMPKPISERADTLNTIPIRVNVPTRGNLLWYKDAHRDGTGGVANPKIIGKGGWQNYRSVFSGGGGIIYAITQDGNLLWYKDTTHNGIGEVANAKLIGKGGWQSYKSVFSGGNGVIYAITQDGNLLWYKDAHRDGTGGVANPKIIGRGGWQNFKSVFSDGSGIIYAVTQDGNLLFYRDTTRNGVGEVANAKEIGHGGWQAYKNVFSGGDGIIYAITDDGNLLWYKDRHRDGTGRVANAKEIGHGGWQAYKNVFSGGGGIMYAITPN